MLVTGGSGYLGRHVLPLAAAAGWDVVAPSSTDCDIRDPTAILQLAISRMPDAVVHLAYRPGDEHVIVEGSGNVARAAAAVGARLVHMSTDVVFHGREDPYDEVDPTDPLSDYGRMKAAAEDAVASRVQDAVLVRTSLMYGVSVLGACQLDVIQATQDPSAMAFFRDEIRCFTPVEDVAAAVVALAGRPDVRGPLHVVGPDAIDRHTFAVRTAGWLGHDAAALRATTLAASGLVRPARVVLTPAHAEELGFTCRSLATMLATSPPPVGSGTA
jgi:dTDP-4-dehydrorhamnose reductase